MRDKVLDVVDEWNRNHPIGTPVKRYRLMNPLDDYWGETVTRSEAWAAGGSPLVLIKGVTGGVHLDSLVVIEEA